MVQSSHTLKKFRKLAYKREGGGGRGRIGLMRNLETSLPFPLPLGRGRGDKGIIGIYERTHYVNPSLALEPFSSANSYKRSLSATYPA